MNNISFDNPWLLFIALPLIAAVLIPFFITVRRDNANFHNVAAVLLNILLCLFFSPVFNGMEVGTGFSQTHGIVLSDGLFFLVNSLEKVPGKVEKIS